MDILALKLITGEDILGEIVKDDDTGVTMKNVVGITVVRGKDGQPSVGFSPFPIHSEPKSDVEISFLLEHIVYKYLPAEDFIKNYNQIFGPGIIMPEEKKLILG
jgi:hypothetical protein